MRYFALLMLVAALDVSAEATLAIDVHGFSRHSYDYEYDFVETNPGLGVAYGTEHLKVASGFFKNSFGDQTVYAGAETMTSGFVRFGVIAGLTYGYVDKKFYVAGSKVVRIVDGKTQLLPAIVPIIAIGDDISLRFMFIPETDSTPATISFSMRFNLMDSA